LIACRNVWIVFSNEPRAVESPSAAPSTFFDASRVSLVLAREGRLPGIFGNVHAATGAPVAGLLASFAISALLAAHYSRELILKAASDD